MRGLMCFIGRTPDPDHRTNSSTTVRIMSDSPDPSNSLASNVSQVTVVTTHPPVLIDAASTPPPPRRGSSEVVILANETNKTQVRIFYGNIVHSIILDQLMLT